MKKRIYLCVLLAAAVISNAVAQCFPPSISLSKTSGSPGEKITMTGRYFSDGCHDVCFFPNCPPPPDYPAKGVRILFIQDEKVQEVGRVDANDKREITADVKIPDSAESPREGYEGRTIRTQRIPFTVTAGR